MIVFQTRKEDMTVERKPAAFGDLRGWLTALRAQGEIQDIDGEVDWNIELGTIARLLQGPATGPSVMFNNIKDLAYRRRGGRPGDLRHR